jgi:hypothetical protein
MFFFKYGVVIPVCQYHVWGSVEAAYVFNVWNTKRGNSPRCIGEWTDHAADLDAVAVLEIADTPPPPPPTCVQ